MPQEAEMLEYALSIDFKAMFVSMVVLIATGLTIWFLIKKIQEITGIETKGMKEKKLLKENINNLKNDLESFKQEQKEYHKIREGYHNQIMTIQEEMKNSINRLTEMVEKKEHQEDKRAMENMRWMILDFANAIRSGRKYDIEAYNHIIEIYDEYEQILEANNMQNGRTTIAMNLIKEKYEIGIRENFPI